MWPKSRSQMVRVCLGDAEPAISSHDAASLLSAARIREGHNAILLAGAAVCPIGLSVVRETLE